MFHLKRLNRRDTVTLVAQSVLRFPVYMFKDADVNLQLLFIEFMIDKLAA